MKFQKFRLQDFSEYKSWYKDPELNKHLGPPPDQEWLDCVMKETNGCQYCVFDKGKMIAVVGIKFPDTEYPFYYITDITIKPEIRKRGVGAKVINELLKLYPIKFGQSWKTSVNVKNPKARLFFEKLGWRCESEVPNKHGMLTFIYP